MIGRYVGFLSPCGEIGDVENGFIKLLGVVKQPLIGICQSRRLFRI